MKILTIIGAFFVIANLLGAFIPGLAAHSYYGSEAGALEWHNKHVQKNKSKAEPKSDHMSCI